ncbi:globin domain-containing protein [Nocardia exalbida]|uniref:globin domain-containing protein n=1 Tax=Nocardia exalbida TaxID=290231 RepID=UPI0035715496
MYQVHPGRGIARHHFDRVVGHLTQALHAAGVQPALTAEIVARLLCRVRRRPHRDEHRRPSLG